MLCANLPCVDELLQLSQGRSKEGRGDASRDAGLLEKEFPQRHERRLLCKCENDLPALAEQERSCDADWLLGRKVAAGV